MEDASAILAKIGKYSLLEVVPGLADLCLEKGQVRLFPGGTKVVTQGEEISNLIIPVSEGFRLSLAADSGGERFLGYLNRGRALGLKEILDGQPYSFSASTETATQALLLPKESFLSCIGLQASVYHYLRMMTRSPGLQQFKKFLYEAGIGYTDLFTIFFQIPGQELVVQAGNSIDLSEPAMFFLKSGRIKVSPKAGGNGSTQELGAGAWFGGRGLVAPFTLPYDAVALEETVYQRAPLDSLRPVLSRLKLIDLLFNEPWLSSDEEGSGAGAAGVLSELPGRLLSRQEQKELGIYVSMESLARASSDQESYAATATNACLLSHVSANPAAVANELSLAGKITLLRIAQAIEPFGVRTRAMKAGQESASRLPYCSIIPYGPRLVLFLLARKKASSVLLLDPARGVVEVSLRDFLERWDGTLLEVIRSERETALTQIFRLLKERSSAVRVIVGFSIILAGLQALIPLASQTLLDQALTLKDPTTVTTCTLGLLLILAFSVPLRLFKQTLQTDFSSSIEREVANELYRHALELPASELGDARAGKILGALSYLVHVRIFLGSSSVDTLSALIVFPAYFLILCLISVKVAASTLVVFAALVYLQLRNGHGLLGESEEIAKLESRQMSIVTEQIESIPIVKAAMTGGEASEKWESSLLDSVRIRERIRLRLARHQGLTDGIRAIAETAALWIASQAALSGEFSPGQVLGVSIYLAQMLRPTSTLASFTAAMARFRVAMKMIDELREKPTELGPAETRGNHKLRVSGKIRLEQVSFRYDEASAWILRDIDLVIYPNQVVALVGVSGSGKSTLAALLAGQIRPTQGRIYFDDFDSTFLSKSTLRRQIGYIMQESQLFRGNLLSNIAYTDDAWSNEAVKEVAGLANALEFIQRMPKGFRYFLGEGGIGLSGGQRQRISLARALYQKPRIVIMDEATSSLDAESESAVAENLKEIFRDRTAIVIAHRLSTIWNADRILVIHEGRIVEDGTHNELLARGGHYSSLFQSAGQVS